MKPKEIVLILSFAFILIVCWIGFNIYHSRITSTISESENVRILPINPNFDTNTIDKLKQRQKVPASFESIKETVKNETTIFPSAQESTNSSQFLPSPTPIIITPSESPTATPTITQSIISVSPTP